MLLLLLLTALLPEMTHLEADFVQSKSSSMFAEETTSQGHLTYRQPDYLKWEYTSPQKMVWEVDGAKDNVSPQVRQIVVLILKTINGSYLQPNSDFNVTWEEIGDSPSQNSSEKGVQTAILTPKRRELKQLFSRITIRLNPQTSIADEVTLYEQSGDTTHIRFTNIRK